MGDAVFVIYPESVRTQSTEPWPMFTLRYWSLVTNLNGVFMTNSDGSIASYTNYATINMPTNQAIFTCTLTLSNISVPPLLLGRAIQPLTAIALIIPTNVPDLTNAGPPLPWKTNGWWTNMPPNIPPHLNPWTLIPGYPHPPAYKSGSGAIKLKESSDSDANASVGIWGVPGSSYHIQSIDALDGSSTWTNWTDSATTLDADGRGTISFDVTNSSEKPMMFFRIKGDD